MKLEGESLISADGQVYHYSHEYEERRGTYPSIKQIYIHQSWMSRLKKKGFQRRLVGILY